MHLLLHLYLHFYLHLHLHLYLHLHLHLHLYLYLYLYSNVFCVLGLLQHTVRHITALALAALAEAARPYGIEFFVSVLNPLREGIKVYRGTVGSRGRD
jgi:hypothetical protein